MGLKTKFEKTQQNMKNRPNINFCARVRLVTPGRCSVITADSRLTLGRRSNRFVCNSIWRAGYWGRCTCPLQLQSSSTKMIHTERVLHLAAWRCSAFVSSRAGVVGRSHCPLRCSTRSNNTFHSIFDPKCFQVPPRTPIDTPTPDKGLCNAKRT